MDVTARRLWQEHRPSRHLAPATGLANTQVACPAPWVSLEIDPAGWVLGCCAGHIYPLGRIGDERLRGIWDGPRQAVLRAALAEWDLSVACAPCRWHLEHGRADPVAATYDAYPMANTAPAGPHMMQFALSNRCNLACVMCNAELSSSIRTKQGLAPLPDRFDDQFFEDVREFLPGTRLLKFQGGEPFLIPGHRRIWEMAAELASPPRMLVTTNGTVFTDTTRWLLDRFEVDISVSVDAATAATYETVRPGGHLTEVHRNIERFHAAVKAKGNLVHVSYCLMDRNHHELMEFLVWAERFENPASINLVSDIGLALHDLELDELREVERRWIAQEVDSAHLLRVNRPVWDTQLVQLRSVIAERVAGERPAPRQPQAPDREVFAAVPSKAVEAETLDREERAIAAWSSDGQVTQLSVDPMGVIFAVDNGRAELGLDKALLGTDLGRMCDHISEVAGRPIWIFDVDVTPQRIVRTFGLSLDARRGTPGTIVRCIDLAIAGTPGRRLLVAVDRIYERSGAAVVIRTRDG